MRRIHVANLKEGMYIAKPIFSSNGIVLLSEGTILTERYIEKIIGTGLQHIYINDEISKGIFGNDLISEETKADVKKSLTNSIKKMKLGFYNTNSDIISKMEGIIKEIISNPRIMISIQEIRNKSDYSLMHAINVCCLSCLIGTKMNYTYSQLKQLTLGALFHDLGKVNLMMDCTRYREDYIEQELIIYRQHVEEGHEMIQEIPEISLSAANIARFHHENYDGTGFPLGLKENDIPEFARIVAIANEYDNFLFNLPFGIHMKHYEIIEVIIAKAYSHFDPKIIKIFSNSISPYYLGTTVILNDNRVGIVSQINEEFPTRPSVRIINQDNLQVIEEIDLSKARSTFIIDEIDIDK